MARPLLPEGLWAEIAPLLPPERAKPMGGRPRTSDRAALTGILFVLRASTPLELLPREMGCSSGMTGWRRSRDWQKAGMWDGRQHALLDRLAFIAPVIVALLAGPALATPLGSSDVQGLIREYNAANAPCRATDRRRQTQIACDRRSAYAFRLDQLGWCLGKQSDDAPDMRWHRCGPDSLHFGD